MKIVMVSGFFDPFHDAHLAYIKQAARCGDRVYCLVASDKQVIAKKGKVNIPARARREIVDLILTGMGLPHATYINRWDKSTTLIAKAIKGIKPGILFRGNDKSLETMPPEERRVCEELGIEIIHARLPFERHGSEIVW